MSYALEHYGFRETITGKLNKALAVFWFSIIVYNFSDLLRVINLRMEDKAWKCSGDVSAEVDLISDCTVGEYQHLQCKNWGTKLKQTNYSHASNISHALLFIPKYD
jgi:hypothetical protein